METVRAGPGCNRSGRDAPLQRHRGQFERAQELQPLAATPTIAAPHGSYLAVLRRGTGEEHSHSNAEVS